MSVKQKNHKTTLIMRISRQQRSLLDRVIAQGRMGNSAEEVIHRVLLEWAKRKIEKGKRNE